MDREDIRERVAALPDNQLVTWLFVFDKLTNIEARLTALEPGKRPPDTGVREIQDHLRMELKSRTQAKGGT